MYHFPPDFYLPTINSGLCPIQEAKPLFKMVGSQCRMCKDVRLRVMRGEGHMARQCTQQKRLKKSEWFKKKMLLAEALEVGVTLDERT
ncbi:hypothetical protein Tco_1420980 [Tanacetum coccineum]